MKMFGLLFAILLTACSTNTKTVEIKSYPVDPLTKFNIFAFTKKAEFDSEELEQEKDTLIVACSKSFEKNKLKVLNKIVRDDDSAEFLTKGAVGIKTHYEVKEIESGKFKKTIYLTFEKFDERTSRIMSVHGIKGSKTGPEPMSYEVIEDICDAAVKSLDLD